MEAANNNAPSAADEGLEELLDSCLGDFDKPLPENSNVTSGDASKSSSGPVPAAERPNADLNLDPANWGEEFTQFQDMMENFLGQDGEASNIQNLLSGLNVGAEGSEPPDELFLKTMKDLMEGAQNVPQLSPDELANMFGNFDLSGSDSGDAEQIPDFMPMMNNVMQKLMSKELLYPSLKEIVEKYPQWLAENQSSLKTSDYEKYSEQYRLMKSVCDEFEAEGESDSSEVKKTRFENILKLMTKIQNCGNPPKDLVSDMGGHNVPIDEHGNLQIPGMPDQCTIM